MKLKPPFAQTKEVPAPAVADDYFTRMIAEQRRSVITPEHEAYLLEEQKRKATEKADV